MRDLTVDSGGVPLAVRDFGGVGRGVLLLHGLGRTLVDWSVLAPMLTPGGHVVAFDLRGHGLSGGDQWSWEAAVRDIESVAAALELNEPVAVRHSLGERSRRGAR